MRKQYAHAFSSRFQYQENILALKTLMPIVYGYILVDFAGLPITLLIPGLVREFQSDDFRVQIIVQVFIHVASQFIYRILDCLHNNRCLQLLIDNCRNGCFSTDTAIFCKGRS